MIFQINSRSNGLNVEYYHRGYRIGQRDKRNARKSRGVWLSVFCPRANVARFVKGYVDGYTAGDIPHSAYRKPHFSDYVYN